MKKIVAELILLNNKSIYPRVYCIDETGRENEAITVTLCDAIWELRGRPLLELKEGEFKHEVRQFQKPYDNQQAEQISLMV